mmetsp:Transcript_39349/g.95174  ORF Transcript_39349/g.95174 Transcript_39349/m.95174 type:complete len:94 (+) Transcript_39349:1100-1381(+)
MGFAHEIILSPSVCPTNMFCYHDFTTTQKQIHDRKQNEKKTPPSTTTTTTETKTRRNNKEKESVQRQTTPQPTSIVSKQNPLLRALSILLFHL